MPATTAVTTTSNQAIVSLLFGQEAFKAKGKGKGGGGLLGKLGYTLPGHGVRSVKRPGSRGGHPWTDANGGVHYGPKPQGRSNTGGGSGAAAHKPRKAGTAKPKAPKAPKPVTAHNHPAKFKRETTESKIKNKRKMLTELNNTHRTGVDKHGNPLNSDQLAKVKLLRASLRSELKAHRAATAAAASTQNKEVATGGLLPIMPLAQPDPDRPADIAQVHTGAMIALMVPGGIGQAIALPGGESLDDLHLTLAYLGDSDEPYFKENLRLVQDALEEFSTTAKPLYGEISGVGLFNSGGDSLSPTSAFYASFDSPDLASFRATLLSCLSSHGISPASNHGFTPHITLDYIPKGSPIPAIQMPQLPITFEEVWLCWGDARFAYMLGQDSLKPREADGYVNNFDKGQDAASKEVTRQIARQAAAHKPFTVFKDAKGHYRWVGVSSSAAEDADQETISQKALAEDVVRKDVTGDYGPLNWWHVQKKMKIGVCDFNAMDGPLLIESGTFTNDRIAQLIEKAIANGTFKPAMSLEFKHDQPARKEMPIPGLVFNSISRVGRALLPAEVASNPLTRFQVYKSNSSSLPAAKA